MNMFDRLRALKSGAAADAPPTAPPTASTATLADLAAFTPSDVKAEPPPAPATLVDVAKAIAEASDSRNDPPAAGLPPAQRGVQGDVSNGDYADDERSEMDSPGWRKTVLNSIAETRDDLKTAHANVARLRRKLVEIDRRRMERRTRVAANLDKAEIILAEIRNVWR